MIMSSTTDVSETPVGTGTLTPAAQQTTVTTTVPTASPASSEALSCPQTAPQTPLTASTKATPACTTPRTLWYSKKTSNPPLCEHRFTALYRFIHFHHLYSCLSFEDKAKHRVHCASIMGDSLGVAFNRQVFCILYCILESGIVGQIGSCTHETIRVVKMCVTEKHTMLFTSL